MLETFFYQAFSHTSAAQGNSRDNSFSVGFNFYYFILKSTPDDRIGMLVYVLRGRGDVLLTRKFYILQALLQRIMKMLTREILLPQNILHIVAGIL